MERRECNYRWEIDGALKGNCEEKKVQQKAVWKDSRKER
jgi:hypothetical protein